MTDTPKCKEKVCDRSNRWLRGYPCKNKAVTAAGYCRMHDPDLRKERDAKRGPSKWERWRAASDRLQDLQKQIAERYPNDPLVKDLLQAIHTEWSLRL